MVIILLCFCVDNGVKFWYVGGGIVYNEDFNELYNVMWCFVVVDVFLVGDLLYFVLVFYLFVLKYLGMVKMFFKFVGVYCFFGVCGLFIFFYFKCEDEGGVVYMVSNGVF